MNVVVNDDMVTLHGHAAAAAVMQPSATSSSEERELFAIFSGLRVMTMTSAVSAIVPPPQNVAFGMTERPSSSFEPLVDSLQGGD